MRQVQDIIALRLLSSPMGAVQSRLTCGQTSGSGNAPPTAPLDPRFRGGDGGRAENDRREGRERFLCCPSSAFFMRQVQDIIALRLLSSPIASYLRADDWGRERPTQSPSLDPRFRGGDGGRAENDRRENTNGFLCYAKFRFLYAPGSGHDCPETPEQSNRVLLAGRRVEAGTPLPQPPWTPAFAGVTVGGPRMTAEGARTVLCYVEFRFLYAPGSGHDCPETPEQSNGAVQSY